ncbi:unnamed protein product, partial [Linum tenue]
VVVAVVVIDGIVVEIKKQRKRKKNKKQRKQQNTAQKQRVAGRRGCGGRGWVDSLAILRVLLNCHSSTRGNYYHKQRSLRVH